MTLTLRPIGNSKGLIIPASLLKSLSITNEDKLEAIECQGGLLIRKIDAQIKATPFSSLDEWVDTHISLDGDSVADSLEYVEGIRSMRANKEISKW